MTFERIVSELQLDVAWSLYMFVYIYVCIVDNMSMYDIHTLAYLFFVYYVYIYIRLGESGWLALASGSFGSLPCNKHNGLTWAVVQNPRDISWYRL